jgi:hypothetical protein
MVLSLAFKLFMQLDYCRLLLCLQTLPLSQKRVPLTAMIHVNFMLIAEPLYLIDPYLIDPWLWLRLWLW